jgi:transcriptional regulator with XRE-family HTH domain
MNKFGPTIRTARRAKNLTIPQLADKIGLHFSTLTRIENGVIITKPNEERIRLLAAILNLDHNELIQFAWQDYESRPTGPDQNHRRLSDEEKKGQKHVNYRVSKCAELFYTARIKLGYSQKELAKKLKISMTSIANFERGLRGIKYSEKKYQRIAKTLNIDFDSLLASYIQDCLRYVLHNKRLTCKKVQGQNFRISLN